MRTKLMLEALAAWLALAAVSGQACAAMQTGANRVFGANSVFTMVANPEVPPEEITRPYQEGKAPANGSTRANADVALLTSAAPSRKNGGTEVKRRAVFNQHDVVGASQGVLVAANGSGDQGKAIEVARNGDLDGEKFYLIANAKLAPAPTVPVPEPGDWTTVLAGLLGVIAIARRRMSL